jgi:hypothetical protein
MPEPAVRHPGNTLVNVHYNEINPTFPPLFYLGASHLIDTNFAILGRGIDEEPYPQPDGLAMSDDYTGLTPDDEDGVLFGLPMIRDSSVPVTIVLNAPADCTLNAWVDFNGSGIWGDTLSEFIFVSSTLTPASTHSPLRFHLTRCWAPTMPGSV